MAKLVKVVPMLSVVSATRAANTYARPTGSPQFLYTSANWAATTVTIYFEAVIATAAGTGYAALYTTGGSVVANSEVTTTNTGATRVRSAAITLSDATAYEVRIKNSASNTTTIYDARIIIVLNGTITAFETHIPLQSLNATTTSTSYTTPSTSGNLLYTADHWDGASIYLEANLSNNTAGNLAYCELQDNGGSSVTSSQISITGTTYARARSSALTLTDAGVYWPAIKASATTARISDARLIIVQSSATKTESHYVLKNHNSSTTSTSFVDKNGRAYWDNDEFSVGAKNHYLESVLYIANVAATASLEMYDGSTTLATITSAVNSRTRVRSAPIIPADNTEYIPRLKTSNASYSAATIAPKVISVIRSIATVDRLVQTVTAVGQVNGSKQITIAPTASNVTAGNVLILTTNMNSNTATEIASVSDSSSNTWTRATGATESSFSTSEIWYAYNIAGGVKPTITITTTNSSVNCALTLIEVSGLTTTDPLDKVAAASSSGASSLSSGSTATLSQASELVIGAGGINSSTAFPNKCDTGFVIVEHARYATDGENAYVAMKEVSATTAQSATFYTAGLSGHCVSCVATFKIAGAGNNYTSTLSDTFTWSDAIVRAAAKVISDTETTSDNISKQGQKVKSDTVTTTDSISKQGQKVRSDSFSFSDLLITAITYGKVLVDTIATWTDSITKSLTRTFSDTQTTSDGATKQTAKMYEEQFTVTDSKTSVITKAINSIISWTENFSITKVLNRIFSDSFEVTEDFSISKMLFRVFEDSITYTSTLLKTAQKQILDIFTYTDSIKKYLNGVLVKWNNMVQAVRSWGNKEKNANTWDNISRDSTVFAVKETVDTGLTNKEQPSTVWENKPNE